MNITKFDEKLNKVEGNTYVIEDVVIPVNGIYEAELAHDNVNLTTLNVYTGSQLTGDRINTYITSTPSLTPWKTVIKIYSNLSPLYISYETSGDQVEADDINNLQDDVNNTQKALNDETDRAINAEKVLTDNLNAEIVRAKGSENTINSNLNAEITRAKASENTITNAINSNKPNWDDKYTKNEIDNKISAVVTSLDYKEHVSTFAELVTTYPNPQDGWTVSVDVDNITYKYNGSSWIPISANSIPLASSTTDGKMSKQDKIDHDDMVNKRHTHSNKGILDVITQALLDAWNAAYTHVSDAIRHITQDERNKWNNTASTIANGTVNDSDKLDGLDSTMFYQRLSDQVTQGSNWNNFMAPGTYKVQNMSKSDNGAPQCIYQYGLLLVDRTAENDTENRISQIYLPHTDSDPYIYTRMCNSGVWTGWRVIPLNNSNQKVWTSNNDGKGSGLDADLFQGKSPTDFAPSGYGLGGTGKRLASGTDLNNIKANGWYDVQDPVNAPYTTSSGWFNFLVVCSQDSGYLTQLGFGMTVNVGTMYYRTCNGSVWGEWQTVSKNGHTHDDRYYTETEADNKFATKDQISQAGYGDMLKSIYDTNNSGVVDKAEKLSTARKINGVTFDGTSDINLTPESLGANKWTYMYKHAEGSGVINYSKIFSVTITGTYADVAECFIISCRSNKIALIMVTASCGNDLKSANVKVEVFPLTTNAMTIVNYFRAGTISVSTTVDGIELWMKMGTWDECQIYPQTTMRRQYTVTYYNGSVNTAFPTYFTSYVDSQLLAIKASSLKGQVTWNDLEGI